MIRVVQPEEKQWIIPADENNQTFSEIYKEYFPRIYNYVFYRVNNYHDADDLCSEIFVKIFANLKHYHAEKASLAVWIFRIARNTVIDYYRRGLRASAPLDAIRDLSDWQPGLEDRAASQEMLEQLREALNSLSQREREIIALKFWSGFSNREIAGFIGISTSSIGVTLFRAMRRLRMILENRGLSIND